MDLHKSILQTLAFWDIFFHPLTKEELYEMLYGVDKQILDYTDFINELHRFFEQGMVGCQDGFCFLPGREKIVDIRQLKVKLIEQKMKIARRGIKKLAKAPFVRAVFVCNTVAMGFADEDSDIDVLIIVKKGRIWLARFLATLALSLFGLRRTKTKIKNKICLSFYLSDDSLNLEKIAVKDDIYLIYWIDNLIPVYDPENLHQSFLNANRWVSKYLPNGLRAYMLGAYCNTPIRKLFEKMWSGSYGDLMEKQAKAIQLAKMKRNYQSAQNAGDTRVVVSDSMLKFHEMDRREEYRDKWLKILTEYNQDINKI